MAPSLWEESSAMVFTGRLCPPAREQSCALCPVTVRDDTQNALCGPGRNPAPVSRERSPANIWAADELKMARQGDLSPCAFPYRHFNQHPLHHQHQQSHRTGVQHRSNCQQQQQRGRGWQAIDGSGEGGKAATGNNWSGGLDYAGDSNGFWRTARVETMTASPKSSVSSDESWSGVSGGGLVGNSPATVWELDSTRQGNGGLSGERKTKMSMRTVAESGVGPQQLQAIWLRESLASLRDKVQSIDELKKLLMCKSMEQESARSNFKEEMTGLERDARELLQELLNKNKQSSTFEHCPPSLSYIYPEDPSVELPRFKSDVTKSDNLSFTHSHHQLHPYSPVDILADVVSTTELHNIRSIPDSSNIAISQQALLPEYRDSMTMKLSMGMSKLDRASAIIDSLVMKKPLPEKGKLLQAVMEAGPLLRTLLVAGPLPQWQNPPPLKPFDIPPVSVKAHHAGSFDQSAPLNPNYLVQSTAKAFHCQNSLVTSRLYAASSMKPSSLSALCMRVPMPSTCASSYKVPFAKRQKI